MNPDGDRNQFLIAMYNQLMNDINRHIIVIWQSIATLFTAVAGFSFVEKGVIPFDVAATVVVMTSVWLIAHVYDASYWYNRNLVIIANIERQFLRVSDLHDIHYYFGKHRPKCRMISHLKIQRMLGLAVAALVLLYHGLTVLRPAVCPTWNLEWTNLLPWVAALFGVYIWCVYAIDTRKKYEEFVVNSPGIPIDTTGVEYKRGHGFGGKDS